MLSAGIPQKLIRYTRQLFCLFFSFLFQNVIKIIEDEMVEFLIKT